MEPARTEGGAAFSRERARRRYRAAAAARLAGLPKLARPAPFSRPALDALGLLASALVHGGVLLLILHAGLRPLPIEPAAPVEFTLVEKERPKPPPPPAPPKVEEKMPPPPRLALARPKNLPPPPKDAPPPPPHVTENLPPPPNASPPRDEKPQPQAPLMIGVSLSSTTAAGGFAAPVGNTLYGAAPQVAPKPEEARPYASPTGRYLPPYKVTELPKVLTEVKADYPDEARKLGLEGQVILRVTIDATGAVAAVKVVKGLGHGFDESALAAMKKYRFKPGLEGSDPVATEITYTMTFVLD